MVIEWFLIFKTIFFVMLFLSLPIWLWLIGLVIHFPLKEIFCCIRQAAEDWIEGVKGAVKYIITGE